MKNKLKINAAITTAAMLICVVLLNLIISAVTAKAPLKIDLTREKIYSFSEQTKQVISNLEKDLNVYALYPDDTEDYYTKYVREYLSRYENMSDRFHVTYVDPYNDPSFVKKFEANGDSLNVGSIVVSSGDNFRVLSFEDLYNSNKYAISIDMERKMTSAVMNVTGAAGEIVMYFTEGHDEYACSGVKSAFSSVGYRSENINLAMKALPDDASVLIIADPSRDFTAEEINEIDRFSDKGGQLMLLSEPGKEIPQRLAAYLADWGITIENDYVIENDPDHAYRSQYGGVVPAPEMQEHDITTNLRAQNIHFMAPTSRSISIRTANTYTAQSVPLLTTTENSWGKTDLSSENISKEAADNEGPLNIAVLSTRYSADNIQSDMFVIGSLAALETEGILTQSTYANGDFLLNCAAYMTHSSDILDIHAKQISAEALTMSQSQISIVTVLLLYLLPAVIFAIGIVVWWRRRYL